jgi:hypothetical protein
LISQVIVAAGEGIGEFGNFDGKGDGFLIDGQIFKNGIPGLQLN